MAVARSVTLTLPIFCLSEHRQRSPLLSQAHLAGTTFMVGPDARRALLAYRHRSTAAAHIDLMRKLKPWPVLTLLAMDRLALVAIGRFQCRWLALEPDRLVQTAEAFVDLVAWLRGRKPWTPALDEFGRTSGIGTPEALLSVVSV
jgi:hypothetical protein